MTNKFKALECKKCGAPLEKQNEDDVYACPYCTVNYILEHSGTRTKEKINYIPHVVEKEEIKPLFKKWAAKGNFTPDDLVVEAEIITSMRILFPVYKIWGNYMVHWNGEIGFDKYRTEVYYEDGKRKTKKVKYTDWDYKDGRYTKSVRKSKVATELKLSFSEFTFLIEYSNFNFKKIKSKPLDEFDEDIKIMERNLPVELVLEDLKGDFGVDFSIYDKRTKLPGDHQRNIDANFEYLNINNKLAYLPYWLVKYKYKGKDYLFLLDAQDGDIRGARPRDATKLKKSELILNNGKYAKYMSGAGALLFFYLNGARSWIEMLLVAILAFIPVSILKSINRVQNRKVINQSKNYRSKLLEAQTKNKDPGKVEPPKFKSLDYYRILYATKLLAVFAAIFLMASTTRYYWPQIDAQIQKIKEKMEQDKPGDNNSDSESQNY